MADDGRTTGVIVSRDHGHTWQGFIPSGEKIAYLRLIEASKTTSGSFFGAGYELWGSSDGDVPKWVLLSGDALR